MEEQEHRSGVRVDTFFTGYQTYRTAGLGHPDDEMADYLEREWMEKAVRWLGRRRSHMGVSFFGIPDQALQEPERYHKAYQKRWSGLERSADVLRKTEFISARRPCTRLISHPGRFREPGVSSETVPGQGRPFTPRLT